ncbi:APH(3'') family aminoglycoside O-phosphotransferase [Streptomyces sp. WAC 06783]|uniref:APH(3'') family aminoglycoside O-phosphotransferase n=1 Tax=Streptomyces sp. WAC 06783 TaxID=2203211 RepID=UPI000F7418C9|nr:APH(3'') family aminoglycoside O-phosphotransferase [Streptomyces sp. WAC 06783]RSO06993.1 APH(3'') family aminoglycoside O-phosphotransferase [Streptomyces sp. WAC 06783]
MTVSLPALRVVLPEGCTGRDWVSVTNGESGAVVLHSSDASCYAKWVPARYADVLVAERDRTEWLSRQGISCPRVLGWKATSKGACLVTSAVPGVPANRVSASQLRAAWGSIADALRHLHGLPTQLCPFNRDLCWMLAEARDVIARGATNTEWLPEHQRGTPPEALLAHLSPQLEARLAQEAAQSVVCHGDLCLPNILLDPKECTVSGFIDLGRLGRADPYADIALLLITSREIWVDDRQAQEADELFAARYGIVLDAERQRFYTHLDPLTLQLIR